MKEKDGVNAITYDPRTKIWTETQTAAPNDVPQSDKPCKDKMGREFVEMMCNPAKLKIATYDYFIQFLDLYYTAFAVTDPMSENIRNTTMELRRNGSQMTRLDMLYTTATCLTISKKQKFHEVY